jgi:putative acetyltransferase
MTERRGIAARAVYRPGDMSDLAAISNVEAQSYSGAQDGLSQALVTAPVDTLSYVATLDGDIVGHVMLTRIEGPERALALAPLAILPQWRDMQIGTELVRHALDHARRNQWRSVFVFGQPGYYRRFGFTSHLADAAQTPWQGPRFMALELVKGALDGWSGPLDYPHAFQAVAEAAHR